MENKISMKIRKLKSFVWISAFLFSYDSVLFCVSEKIMGPVFSAPRKKQIRPMTAMPAVTRIAAVMPQRVMKWPQRKLPAMLPMVMAMGSLPVLLLCPRQEEWHLHSKQKPV